MRTVVEAITTGEIRKWALFRDIELYAIAKYAYKAES